MVPRLALWAFVPLGASWGLPHWAFALLLGASGGLWGWGLGEIDQGSSGPGGTPKSP